LGRAPRTTGISGLPGVLVAWNSPGHEVMATGSIRNVASDVPGWLFGPMLESASAEDSLQYLVKAEDFTAANALGACKIDVKGGQIVHFMRDPFQPELEAYALSVEHILTNGANASRALQPSIRFYYDHPRLAQMTTSAHFAPVRRYLAAALHTLQDSFSPGHVGRDDKLIIQSIFVWDEDNKKHHESDDAAWTSPPNENLWLSKPTDLAGIEGSPLGKASVAAGAQLIRCVYQAASGGIGDAKQRFRNIAARDLIVPFLSHALPPGLRPAEQKKLRENQEKERQERLEWEKRNRERIERNWDKR
jgi:hypothetical protein